MTKITFAAFFAVTVMIAANWTAQFVFRDAYSHQLVIDIPDFDEAPLVNRAALQRSWPNGLSELSMRAQVRAQMQDVENLEPPKRTAALIADTPGPPVPEPDLATLLASADIANGQKRSRICASCHTFDNGGRNGTGPNLWGVVGRDIAATASFDYSDALASEPGSWTFEKLNAYLLKPSAEIPGNQMFYQGIGKARDRADLIAYMRMQGATQIPLPEPAPTEGGDAP